MSENPASLPSFSPPIPWEEAQAWARATVAQMTTDEKISLIGGQDYFFTTPVERLGIPKVCFADASHGVHLRESFRTATYDERLPKSTSFPCLLMLAATWNRDLAAAYGQGVGEECRAGHIPVLLGPGMNIYRQSQCGRNFEYLGEDPFLAGQLAARYIVALQETGTIATMKHFAANNSDYYRRKSNSIVDARTLHEIYLPAFKACIEAGGLALMTSYNLLNGEWTGESATVINDLLRRQLGFKGLVMTDWWSVYDGEKVIKSGQDLEMPAREATENAAQLLADGKVTIEQIERMAVSLLTTLKCMDALERDFEHARIETEFPRHVEVAYEIAKEGVVLLKNRDGLLPLAADTGTVLLTGGALDEIVDGGGAAIVEGYDPVTLASALGTALGDRLTIEENPTAAQLAAAGTVIFNVVTRDSEGWDRPFELPAEIEAAVKRAVAANSRTIVLVNSGSGIRMTDWAEDAAAIAYIWYGGQIGHQAVADLLLGKACPSGKLPMTIERDFADSPGAGYVPAGESLYEGWHDAEEKLRPIHDVVYQEGIFVGYRGYEAKGIAPLFPFGHGLSYTTFAYADLAVSTKRWAGEGAVDLTFTITNTGSHAGKEIAQVYVADAESSLPRPPKELKQFAKVALAPGESTTVRLALPADAFKFWNPASGDWQLEPGTFQILVGPSSADLPLQAAIEL